MPEGGVVAVVDGADPGVAEFVVHVWWRPGELALVGRQDLLEFMVCGGGVVEFVGRGAGGGAGLSPQSTMQWLFMRGRSAERDVGVWECDQFAVGGDDTD